MLWDHPLLASPKTKKKLLIAIRVLPKFSLYNILTLTFFIKKNWKHHRVFNTKLRLDPLTENCDPLFWLHLIFYHTFPKLFQAKLCCVNFPIETNLEPSGLDSRKVEVVMVISHPLRTCPKCMDLTNYVKLKLTLSKRN